MLSYKDIDKITTVLTRNSIKCKCGHTETISHYKDRVICDWCQRYVYRTPQLEFQYRLKEKLAKINKK